MFTPPASPFPSPRAMEEMQRQSRVSPVPSNSSTSSKPDSHSFSQNSYFPSSAGLLTPKNALSNSPTTTTTRNSSSSPSSSPIPSPSTSPLKLSSPPSSKSLSKPQPQSLPLHESQNRSEAKRRTGRHIKWAAIAIPVVLILVTLGNHCMAELLGMAGWIGNTHANKPQVFEGHEAHDIFDMVFDGLHLHHHHARPQSLNPIPTPTIASAEGDEEEGDSLLFRRQTVSIVTASAGTATASNLATPTTAAATSTTATGSSSSTATTSIPATAQNLPTLPTASPVLPTPFPQPWDSDISQNFSTQSCYNFFLNMTNSDNFRSCRPFGMLHRTSNVFSALQSNLTALNNVIWGTCNPTLGVDQCTTNMATFATQLQAACEVDLGDKNANAVNTLQDLQSYSLTYSSGCLTDPSTSSYCYVKAAHNTNPSDLYFYSLPEGVALPNSSSTTLTCSSCTKSLMALYVNALNTDSQGELTELGSVYGAAEREAVSQCGNGYAQASTSEAEDQQNGARAAIGGMSMGWLIALAVGGVLMLLV